MRSASAPASSTPVGPPPTTTKFSAPSPIRPGSRFGLLEDAQDARPQSQRVVEAVERERVLVGARGLKEVGLRPGREHESVAGEALAVRRRQRAGRGIE